MVTDQEILDRIKARVLDRIPFSFGISVSQSWVETVTIEQYIDDISNDIVTQINFAIPGISHKEVIDVPDTAWDEFKESYFPKWLSNLFPVKYTAMCVFEENHLYPKEEFGTPADSGARIAFGNVMSHG